jgi:hypothetical protein
MCKRPETTFFVNQLIQPTWPLQRWGLDLLGPLPPAQGNFIYVVVAVENFSKWIEAKPLATITSITVQKFFWQNIVCCFGVPKAITMDNGTQFDVEALRNYVIKSARRFILRQLEIQSQMDLSKEQMVL